MGGEYRLAVVTFVGALGDLTNGTLSGVARVYFGQCGDGIVSPGEECDGLDVGIETCSTLGFDCGTLTCGLDCALDTLREQPHPTHTHLAQTLEWIERVDPKRAILTHLSTAMDYDALDAKTPANVVPGSPAR